MMKRIEFNKTPIIFKKIARGEDGDVIERVSSNDTVEELRDVIQFAGLLDSVGYVMDTRSRMYFFVSILTGIEIMPSTDPDFLDEQIQLVTQLSFKTIDEVDYVKRLIEVVRRFVHDDSYVVPTPNVVLRKYNKWLKDLTESKVVNIAVFRK